MKKIELLPLFVNSCTDRVEHTRILMKLSTNTIQAKGTSIRKKLGIESQGDIKAYLETKLG